MENKESSKEEGTCFSCFSPTISTTLPTKGLKDLIFEVHFACSVLALYLDHEVDL